MRLIPDSLAGRAAAIIIAAVVATQVVNVLTYFSFLYGKGMQPEQLLAHGLADIRVLDRATPKERGSWVAALSDPTIQLAVNREPPEAERATEMPADEVRHKIRSALQDPDRDVRLLERSQPDPHLVVAVQLKDGSWLSLTISGIPWTGEQIYRVRAVLWLLFAAAIVGALSIWLTRRLSAQLAAFAHAAETLGMDNGGKPIAVTGPRELRRAIRAFNTMQARLRRFIDDRTRMLGAMSHDLRTPLTRLRLRAEFIEDPEQQQKMLLDLEGMGAMIDASLAFAREDARKEEARALDLGALVASVCDDAVDANENVVFEPGPRFEIFGRPHALRRAVANVVDNAVKYGGAARVRLVSGKDECAIEIDDDGPGIPPEDQERVFAPFYRLEASRNPTTGGTGLGLAVARSIARAHGGDISLNNRSGAGLRVTIALPRLPQQMPQLDARPGAIHAKHPQ